MSHFFFYNYTSHLDQLWSKTSIIHQYFKLFLFLFCFYFLFYFHLFSFSLPFIFILFYFVLVFVFCFISCSDEKLTSHGKEILCRMIYCIFSKSCVLVRDSRNSTQLIFHPTCVSNYQEFYGENIEKIKYYLTCMKNLYFVLFYFILFYFSIFHFLTQ